MIGLDTTAVIDFFKGDEEVKDLLNGLQDKIVLNDVIYLELMFGLNSENLKHRNEEAFYDNFFSDFPNLKLTKLASKRASKVLWQLRKSGDIIEPFDCAIAGILLSNGVDKIITRNVKHFEKIKGLKVISY